MLIKKGTKVRSVKDGREGILKADLNVDNPASFFGSDGTEMAVVEKVFNAAGLESLARTTDDAVHEFERRLRSATGYSGAVKRSLEMISQFKAMDPTKRGEIRGKPSEIVSRMSSQLNNVDADIAEVFQYMKAADTAVGKYLMALKDAMAIYENELRHMED